MGMRKQRQTLANDIEKVRRAEERRGRRPRDAETNDERRRREAALREIWNNGTIDDLKGVMLVYGLSEDSPAWKETLRIWKDELEPN